MITKVLKSYPALDYDFFFDINDCNVLSIQVFGQSGVRAPASHRCGHYTRYYFSVLFLGSLLILPESVVIGF